MLIKHLRLGGSSADNSYVWLGSPNDTNNAYYVNTGGVNNNNNRNNSYAVAPAFTKPYG